MIHFLIFQAAAALRHYFRKQPLQTILALAVDYIADTYYATSKILRYYGGPCVQYTKENVNALRKLLIHLKNIQYTFLSPKRISIHNKVSQNTQNIFQYATKSFPMRKELSGETQ